MPEETAPVESSWSRARIEELLRTESFRYQRVPLPHGLATEGRDRSSTARLIFPDDLTGESVIDVGCSLGYFCFEARHRGAARVVGLDHEPENVRKARLLADVLGEPVEFRVADIERDPLEERFDHVLCLNVLHHLGDPLATLDRLVATTRRRLVLEVATLGAHDRRKLGTSWLATLGLSRLPAIMVGRGAAEKGLKQFYLTPRAVENLLCYRHGCFASVELMRSGFKNRFVVIGHKHRIRHLLVVAGPTAAGQSALIERLLRNQLPALNRRLGTDDGALWGSPLAAGRYSAPQPAEKDRMILDYDYLRAATKATKTFDRDPALDILDTADRVTVVTVWTPPAQLTDQLGAAMSAVKGRNRERLGALRDEYRDPHQVVAHYRAWLAFAAAKGADQMVVESTAEGVTVLLPEEWETRIAGPLLACA